jgi:hypothetical protein
VNEGGGLLCPARRRRAGQQQGSEKGGHHAPDASRSPKPLPAFEGMPPSKRLDQGSAGQLPLSGATQTQALSGPASPERCVGSEQQAVPDEQPGVQLLASEPAAPQAAMRKPLTKIVTTFPSLKCDLHASRRAADGNYSEGCTSLNSAALVLRLLGRRVHDAGMVEQLVQRAA